MALYSYESSDIDLLHDFYTDFQDLYEAAEAKILELESEPDRPELLNDLFRSVHTIKGNSGLLGMMPLVDLLQSLESVLDLIRHGQIRFQPLVGDLTLLILDRCSLFIASVERHQEAVYDEGLFQAISNQLNSAIDSEETEQIHLLTKALALLDPTTTQLPVDSDSETLLSQFDIPATEDLQFIIQLAEQTQSRAAFWKGRIKRVLTTLMALNEYAGQPVEREQLLVAVCMHDIGMAMLPSAMINKQEALSQHEIKAMQEHVWVASRLISSFPQWKEAKKIIDHHQENYDGSGYPIGLKGSEICIGGQLLAIVHTFEAITHGYSKSLSRKRPLMRAVMELNRFSGAQFNPKWVQAFMEVTRAA